MLKVAVVEDRREDAEKLKAISPSSARTSKSSSIWTCSATGWNSSTVSRATTIS